MLKLKLEHDLGRDKNLAIDDISEMTNDRQKIIFGSQVQFFSSSFL